MQIRRVVTGQTATGKSVFVSDDVLADRQFRQLWGSDSEVALPTDGTEPKRFPGLLDAMELDNPGMHTTDTIDFDIVLSGEVYLELDDGPEVRLTAGDCVIQNGTRHAWHNRSDEPVTMASALVGARRRE